MNTGRMEGKADGITVGQMRAVLNMLPDTDRLVVYVKSLDQWHDVVGVYPEAMGVVNVLYDTREWR